MQNVTENELVAGNASLRKLRSTKIQFRFVMKVMKFGGTSVGSPERMKEIARLVAADAGPRIIVLSALSGTTNALVQISAALHDGKREAAQAEIDALHRHYKAFADNLFTTDAGRAQGEQILRDHFEFLNIILKISFSDALNKDILAQGELLSTKLFSAYLHETGFDHAWIPALEFMSIDASMEPELPLIAKRLKNILARHTSKQAFVTQGFICRNARGEVDNLKRGGSDYSASLIAAGVQATVCEIWTDIDGMHNNDPRIVEGTSPVRNLSFDEAAELAYFGAKILHPASIWPAQQANIPVKLLDTLEPESPGTVIKREAETDGVKAIAAKTEIIAIKIKSSRMLLAYGFLRKIFEIFEKYKTPIDMVTTSEVAVSLTIDDDTNLDKICRELEMYGKIVIDREQAIISIVGNKISSTPNVLMKIFDSLNNIQIRMVSFGGSQHNVSILVPGSVKNDALRQLHRGLFG